MDFIEVFTYCLSRFSLAFIPLFVAMEPIGIIPIYLSMTRSMNKSEKRNVLFYSLLTATAITLGFLIVGKAIFIALGITISDFQIAGGLILLSIGIGDIVHTARGGADVPHQDGIGIVPFGTPLIAGPAAITTLLMLDDLYGFAVTAAALFANLVITAMTLVWSGSIVKYTGENGARGISKVISLLLAAIAVMMIRKGIMGVIH